MNGKLPSFHGIITCLMHWGITAKPMRITLGGIVYGVVFSMASDVSKAVTNTTARHGHRHPKSAHF